MKKFRNLIVDALGYKTDEFFKSLFTSNKYCTLYYGDKNSALRASVKLADAGLLSTIEVIDDDFRGPEVRLTIDLGGGDL